MTMTNEPTVVDAEGFTVRRTVYIAAPIENVWTAVTDTKHIAGWFGQSVVLESASVGAEGVISFDGYGDVPIRIEELDPPNAVAYRWGGEGSSAPGRVDPDHSTVFRFTLEAADGGTRLTVVETGFETLADPSASMEGNRTGWDAELDELVAYAESMR